jgi:putative ABC transport system permease protein
MKPLLRHTLRSAYDSKAQVIIIVLTVAVVTAMMFVSLTISDVFYQVNMIENERVSQGSDMLLGSNLSMQEYFSRARVESVLTEEPQDIALAEYFLKFTTVMKFEDSTRAVLLEATDLNQYLALHDIGYIEKDEGKRGASGEMPVIVGKSFAENAGLHAGDEIELYIASYNKYVRTYIAYVAADEGIFRSAVNINVLADFSLVGNYGMVSAVYITFSDPGLFEKYANRFAEILPSVPCLEGSDYTGAKNIVFNNTLLFAIGVAFVTATMSLILMTSYMVIARKRTREMVVFKAAGASPAQTALIMLTEVTFYAMTGAAIGLALGRLLMQIIIQNLAPYSVSFFAYPFWKFAASAFIAAGVTIISSLVPIIRISRQTIHELLSQSPRIAGSPRPIGFLIATACAAGLLAATYFLEGILLAIISLLDIAAIILWIVLAVPLILKGVTLLLSKIKKDGGFGLGALTPNRNKAMQTITALIAVVIAFSFIVVQIVALVKYAVTPFEARYSADAVVLVESETSMEQRYRLYNSLWDEGVSFVGYMHGVEFRLPMGKMDLADGEKFCTIYGVNSAEMLAHCAPGLQPGTLERWDSLENPIVLTQDMLLRLGLKIGDEISFVPFDEDYRSKVKTFTVAGVDTTVTRYDRIGFVRFEELEAFPGGLTYFIDYGAGGADTLSDLIQAVDAQDLTRSFVLTFEEYASAGDDSLEGILGIMTFMQYAVIAVGLIGMINVAVVTVFDRKTEFELYRLCGLSRRGYMSFSAAEGLSVSFSGGLIGFAVCIVLNRLLPVFVGIVDKYLYFAPVSALSAGLAASGMVVFAGCWQLIAALKRENVVRPINERYLQ